MYFISERVKYVTVQQELQTPFVLIRSETQLSLDSLDCVLCAALSDWSIQPLLIDLTTVKARTSSLMRSRYKGSIIRLSPSVHGKRS